MTTTTTPRTSRGRRVAAFAAAGTAALVAIGAVALPVGERTEAAGADPTSISATSSSSSSTTAEPTTTTTIDPVSMLTTWYDGLSDDERGAFQLMSASDDERAAWSSFVTAVANPAPEPQPEPAPEPEAAPVEPAQVEPVPEAAPAGPPPAPVSCSSFSSQDEATAWLQANAAAYDMTNIDSNGDGIPCTVAFAPPPPATSSAPSTGPANSFLACVRQRESRGNYSVVNSSSGAGGAYQFLQTTWNNTARHAGRSDLVGVHPSNAAPGDQDAMAAHLYSWQGRAPWAGGGC